MHLDLTDSSIQMTYRWRQVLGIELQPLQTMGNLLHTVHCTAFLKNVKLPAIIKEILISLSLCQE